MPMFKKPNLGSGGQGGEFVYSCLKLSRRNIYTILVPNIATIATSKGLADNVYFRTLTHEIIIQYQKSDGVYTTWWIDNARGRHQVRRFHPPHTLRSRPSSRWRTSSPFVVLMERIGEKCVQSVTATMTEVGDWNTVRTQSHLARVPHCRGTYET